jgi:DNA invertase Pin-like site-specific DNA recombinase
MSAIGYSYVRFSTPDQARGDSLRRQTEAAQDWCQRNQVSLDTSTTLHDLGKSAYLGEHRKNPDRNALASFLKMAEQGKIRKGSYLIVENLDRLTREHVRAAVTLFLSILEQGVSIVTTSPERVFRHDSQDMTDVIIAVVELARGHSESKVKSERVGSAWQQKKKAATENKPQPKLPYGKREGTKLLTNMLPAWLEEKGGKAVPIPARAAAVKRIFQLAATGYGHQAIVKKLEAEKVPPFGQSDHWTTSYIHVILKDRRVLGEHQPGFKRKGRKVPDGEPIPGYYPAVVSEAEFNAVRLDIKGRMGHLHEAHQARRMPRGGQNGEALNVFAGLLRNARDGESYFLTLRNDEGGRRHVLINFSATEGRAPCYAFPYPIFQRAILSCLREIDPKEILNGDRGPDETQVLGGELARVETELAEASAFMHASGFSVTIGKRVAELETRQRELNEQLREARQRAEHPLSETWGEAQTLMDTLDSAPDPVDARLRLRSTLRRLVEGVWILVVRRGRVRLCTVQIWFSREGGKARRDYLIMHRQAQGNASARVPEQWWVRSFADTALPSDLDLRKRGDVAQLAKALLAIDLAVGQV